ncbi:MAG TPA: hypothetical protein VMH87_01905 [Pseudomonadales bacterium]|nr:hypothetical protein [Pseudomonadales bacterium]
MKFAALKDGGGWLAASGAVLTAMGLGTTTVRAHGFVGDRFFPPTIQTDDPFAVDELALPTVSTIINPGSPATRETDIGVSFSKEILPKFAISLSETYVNLAPEGMPSVGGFDNLSLNAKYQLWENVPHEAIFSVGSDWDVGGTGAKKIGATSANVFTPTVYYGKGFGDLPDALTYARPFALTGTLGVEFPTSADPNTVDWGFALEYNLPYLQSEVKDIGLPGPFNKMIPVVEFAFSTPFNRGGGPTTGTINPGILYENNYFQIGAEAIIPANSATGGRVGAVFQIQIYIDDIWPKTFGHPLFGE